MAERMDSIHMPQSGVSSRDGRDMRTFGSRNFKPNPRNVAYRPTGPPKQGTFLPKKEFVPMSPEERKRLIAEKKCFFCRESGHMLPDCPKRASKKVNALEVHSDQGLSSQGN